jgi:SNF2 family DNA or RNA helicase
MADHIEKTVVLWESSKNKETEYKKLFESSDNLQILIMNVEALSTKKGKTFAWKFLNCHTSMMAVDEATTIKNPGAQRTKNIIELGQNAKYKRILTGSPVTKSPLDLFTQCYFLDPWLLDQQSYYAFRVRYAKMRSINVSGRQVQIVVGYRNLGELTEKIKNFSYRCLKDDCLDLPRKTYMKRIIELTDEQKKLYKQMKEKALAVLNGKMVTSMTVITQMMRLHQITCGHFKSDDGDVQKVKSKRLDELLNLLDELEGKAIIWAHYRHDIESIVEEVKKKHGDDSILTYYGDTSTEDRQKAIEKIQDLSSPVRFLVGTPQTGGYGITLTAASTMIYYSNGYDLEKRQQSEARIDRIGQSKPMTYVDIIAEETIDEKIVEALRRKVNLATEIMGEELKDWI